MNNRIPRQPNTFAKTQAKKTTGKHIVLTTFGSLGDLHPYIAIALELQARGHRCVIATEERYRSKIEAQGLEFHPVRPNGLPDIEKDWEFFQHLMDCQRLIEYGICYLLMPHLRASYIDLMEAVREADLLVTHPLTFVGSLVAQKTGIPWISTVLVPSTFMSAYDNPNLSTVRVWSKPVGVQEDKGDKEGFSSLPTTSDYTLNVPLSPWERALELVASDTQMRRIRWQTRLWSAPIRQLRAELGLAPDSDPVFEGQHSPHLVLALFSSVLGAAQPDWPPQTCITGFPLYNSHNGDTLYSKLIEFLQAGSPPIVFTLGSTAVWTAGNFYQEGAAAAQKLGYRAILLIGQGVPRSLESLPEGVMAVEYAPHSELFKNATAIVHHGGVGTTAQALRSGRPMLIVPHAYDQPDNAARLVRLGVARTIPRHNSTADRIATELKYLLFDSKYANRCAEVRDQVRGEDGVGVACDAIEAYL
ncbi:MAG TPA: glycosyltransferase [Cyanobacteria bacterium UBA11162]|nr:glycosyltransferase [Cyanobacteria bacterium UBA11162]